MGKLHFTWARGGLLIAGALAALAAPLAAQAPRGDMAPVWSPISDDIAFESDRDGDSDIYLLNFASGKVESLTDNSASDLAPSWSPDGRHLAFYSSRDGNFEI